MSAVWFIGAMASARNPPPRPMKKDRKIQAASDARAEVAVL